MSWKASITYASASGWLTLDNPAGLGAASIRVFVKPQGLAPGTYQATIVVDAGPYAGSQTIPATLTVQTPSSNASPTPTAQSTVVVASVVNAATFQATPLVPGSLGTLFGSNLAGKEVSVAFDSLPATLLRVGQGCCDSGRAGRNPGHKQESPPRPEPGGPGGRVDAIG